MYHHLSSTFVFYPFIPGNCQPTIQTSNEDGSDPPSYSQYTWYEQYLNQPRDWQFTFYVEAGEKAYIKLAQSYEADSSNPAFEIGM